MASNDQEDIAGAIAQFGGGAITGMYQMMLDRLDAGKDTEAGGVKTFAMAASRYVRDKTGKLRSVAELQRFVAEITKVKSDAAAVNAVLARWGAGPQQQQPAAPSAPSSPVEMRPNALLDDAFGDVSAPGSPAGGSSSGPVEMRPNALLDDVFNPQPPAGRATGGGGSSGGPSKPAGPDDDDAPIPLAPDPPTSPQSAPGGGGTYNVLPPPKLPSRPNLPTPGTGGIGGGLNPADLTRLVREIRDGVMKLVERAAKGGGAGGGGPPDKPEPGESGYSWGDATRPVTDWMKNTRLGRIGSRFAQRVRPAAKAGAKAYRAGRATGKNPSKGPPVPPGGKPPIPPVPAAGAGAAGGAAGAEAGAGGAAAAGGMAVPVVGAAIAATVALVELAKAGRELAYAQERRTRELAEYNSAQAGQAAQLDYGRVQRSMESGQNTAATSGDLTNSINDFENKLRPLTDAIDNVSNLVGARVLDVLGVVADGIAPLADAITELAKLMPGYQKPEGDTSFGGQLARIDQEVQQRAEAARQAGQAARDAMRWLGRGG